MATRKKLPYTLYKRNEIYHARFSFIHENERIQFIETTRKRELEAAHRYCIDRIAHFKLQSLHDKSLDFIFGRFYEERGLKQSSPYGLKKRLQILLSGLGAGTMLSSIAKSDIQQHIFQRGKAGKAPSTICRELNDLIAVFNAARDWGYIVPEINISKLKPKLPDHDIEHFTHAEIEKIIANASPHMRPIIYCAIYTGFRKQNILGLKWSNIDWETKTITIRVKDRTRPGGRVHSIPMSRPLEDLLLKTKREGEYVFLFDGQKIKDIKTAWHATLRRAGVRYRKFHDLRHTTATMLLAKGTDPATLSKILGHSNINTTIKYYAAVLDEGKRAALDSLSN
jgi:integrase